MSERSLKRAGGNWVDKERFWNRQSELQLLTKDLQEGTHVLLIAQRRMGKTSLMREVSHRIASNFICLHVDLEKALSPADAIAELSTATRPYESLWEKTKGIYANTLGKVVDQIESLQLSEIGVRFRSGLTEGDWQAKGDHLFDELAKSEKPVVLFIDEVPILVNRMLKGHDYQITPERREQTDRFMSWIRDNSMRHKGKVRMVLTGSIGLEPILRQGGLSATINTFVPLNLGPWSPEIAAGCLAALGKEYQLIFEKGALEEIVNRLGSCVPHHVQMFFNFIYEACVTEGMTTVSNALVGQVYDNAMLSIRGHAELSHMEERLKTAFGHELHPLALELLTEAATRGTLTIEAIQTISSSANKSKDVVADILGVLEHDGYLHNGRDGYTFNSKLLRDWWKARFGMVYVSTIEKGKGTK